MIEFRCSCGHGLRVREADAGGSVQCPRCGRLRSIPELDELAAMEEDGTIRVAEGPPAPAHTIADFPAWTDQNGIDRRSTLEQILAVGPPPDPPRSAAKRPRYDPETGEIVREFAVAEPAPRADIPPGWPEPFPPEAPATALPQGLKPTPAPIIPASAATPHTLAYAHKRADYGRFGSGQVPIPLNVRPVFWYTIPLELFQPANVMVMGFVLLIHLVIQGLGMLTLLGALPLAMLAIWIWLVVLAHYVIILDETGPERRDEMPGVLRNVSLGDDFITPLWALFTSIAICFGPAAVAARAAAWSNAPPGLIPIIVLVSVVSGVVFFPATLLTAATSGSVMNLAPHRIVGVILAAPLKYLLSVVLLVVTAALYAFGVGATGWLTLVGAGWVTGTTFALWLASGLGYLALMGGIYGAHAFAWLLGKIYQDHHEQFPWVLQRHISTRTDPTKILERQRAGQILAEREEQARRASAKVRARLTARP